VLGGAERERESRQSLSARGEGAGERTASKAPRRPRTQVVNLRRFGSLVEHSNRWSERRSSIEQRAALLRSEGSSVPIRALRSARPRRRAGDGRRSRCLRGER
jgi:hypothetical protein